MTLLSPPPIIQPLLDHKGFLTRPWVQWLDDLFRRIGGPLGPDLDDGLYLDDSFVNRSEIVPKQTEEQLFGLSSVDLARISKLIQDSQSLFVGGCGQNQALDRVTAELQAYWAMHQDPTPAQHQPTVSDLWDDMPSSLPPVTSVTGAAPVTSTGGRTPAIGIIPATTLVPGSMSATDKAKLDAISPQPPASITKEFTGFSDPSAAAAGMTYDPTTQKITITGVWAAYFQGAVIAALTSGWVSDAHPNTTGHTYWLYHDGAAFAWMTDAFPGFDKVLIATVHYGVTNKFACCECHGLNMPYTVHQSEHNTMGTYRLSGGTLAGYTLSSTTAAERRPSVSQSVLMDEDLPITNLALADNGPYTQLWIDGPTESVSALADADIVRLSGANPYYNSYSAPNWGQTLMPANSVATVWLIGIPTTKDATSQAFRLTWKEPQWITQATSGAAPHMAQALASELQRLPSELVFGDLFTLLPEFIPMARVCIAYTGGDWTIVSVSNLTGNKYSLVGSPAGFYLASVTATAPIVGTGTVADPLAMAAATDLVPGHLTAADHILFTNKRERLTGARTYYVRTDGNDGNTGLVNDAAGAFLTIQKAVDATSILDMANQQITIQLGAGTYVGGVVLKGVMGSKYPIILGDVTTPSNVICQSTSGVLFYLSAAGSQAPCTWAIQGVQMTTTGSGTHCVQSSAGNNVRLSYIDFAVAVGMHMQCTDRASITLVTSYTISGACTRHIYATGLAKITLTTSTTVTITGTPAWTNYFAGAFKCALIEVQSITFSGAATGVRWSVDSNSIIFAGGGAAYLPGNSDGTDTNGGIYIV